MLCNLKSLHLKYISTKQAIRSQHIGNGDDNPPPQRGQRGQDELRHVKLLPLGKGILSEYHGLGIKTRLLF